MLTIEVPEVGRINVARTGARTGSQDGSQDRAPLVLVHGVGLDLTWWGAQFEAFGGSREVVAFDLPGHGLSGGGDRVPSFLLMARALEGVLESLGGRAAHVVGLSVGGMIAQVAALRRPALIRSLGLVATWGSFPAEVRAVLRERAAVARRDGMARIAALSNERWFSAGFRARRPDILSRTTRSLLQQDPTFHAGMWEMIAGLDLAARLPEIEQPTLVVTGELDINAPAAAADGLLAGIRGSRLVAMPGVSHFPPVEAADAFNRIVGDFLRDVERAGPSGGPPAAG